MTKPALTARPAIGAGLPILLLLAALSVPGASPVRAQGPVEPTLVRDIDSSTAEGSSFPERMIELDGVAVFTAEDPLHGRELWASDATAGGTRRIADICPGACSTTFFFRWAAGGRYFFHAVPELPRQPEGADPAIVPGRGLWSTDGTPDGTRRLTEIGPTVYFEADAGGTGRELWTSEGTPESARLFADLCPGECSSHPSALAAHGTGSLSFTATDGVHGREIWRSDRTAAGTRMIADL